MEFKYPTEWPQFYTATCYDWLPLLENDKHKNIIIESLKFLVNKNRIRLNAFVIMKNHIHLIWQALQKYSYGQIQLSFMKYTAQQIKFELIKNNPELLAKCQVNKLDREYQIWKREPLSIELFTEDVYYQKFDYLHYNPVKAGLCILPEDYYFSSAYFHQYGIDRFNMLAHYKI